MNIHEYQAKAVLRDFGVPVPRGIPAFTVEDAVKGAHQLGGPVWVVKAQIHAGGRGKAGGVKVVKSVDDVQREAQRLLGATLVTHQTGPKGKQVNRLYIEEGSPIEKEFYLSALVDRATSRVAFVASTEGGMDIEAVAHDTPEKIETFTIDPATGLMPHHGREVAAALGYSDAYGTDIETLVRLVVNRIPDRPALTATLRCIFGNPFRPARVEPSWLRWGDGAVRRIAETINDEGDFARVGVLADALQDAGCDDERLLAHLRDPGPHVRGCWVIDLLRLA